MATENDSSEVTREVRDIDKVLTGFCEINCLAATDAECDILLEVMPVGSWILKFRHNGLIVNCSEIILSRPEYDATITFVTPKSFWSIVNYGGNIQDFVVRGNVRQSGSGTALGVFNDRFLPSVTVSVTPTLGRTQLQQLPLTPYAASPRIPMSTTNQLPLKTGFLLKKRDVLSGWRCRYFKVYYGRLDYFVGKFDALPRGSIDLLAAKVSLAGKATINGAEHCTLLVEPRRDRACRLASDMVGDAGVAEAQTWQIVFRLAAERMKVEDPDPEALQTDNPEQSRLRGDLGLGLVLGVAKDQSGIGSSVYKGSTSVVGGGKGYKSSLTTSVVDTTHLITQYRYTAVAVGSTMLAVLLATWLRLGLTVITLSVVGGTLCSGVIVLGSRCRVPHVRGEPSSSYSADMSSKTAIASIAGARSTQRSFLPEALSPSPRTAPHRTAVSDPAPATLIRANSADLPSHSTLPGAPSVTNSKLSSASTTTARGSAIKLSSAIQGLFRRDNSARQVAATSNAGATRSAVPTETVVAKRVSPWRVRQLRDVDNSREGSGESDGGDTDLDRQSTCAQPSPTGLRHDRTSGNTSPVRRSRVVNFASPSEYLYDSHPEAVRDPQSNQLIHPLVSDDESAEGSRDLDDSFTRPATYLHRRSLSESSFSLAGYVHSGAASSSSTPINSSAMRESFADDPPR